MECLISLCVAMETAGDTSALKRQPMSLVRQRAQSLEAQQKEAKERANTAEAASGLARVKCCSDGADRMRQRFGVSDANGKPPPPRRKLANITEQRVLKTGVRRFHKDFVEEKAADIMQLPKRKDGTPKLMSTAFFQRLFSDKIELKGCLQSDVAAAQPDVRHLSTEQLLAARAATLDFQTESERHSAHNSFLNTVDTHLFEKLARCCLERSNANAVSQASAQALFETGVRITMMLGAAELLADGWDSKQGETNEELPAVPQCFAVRLDEKQWQGSRFAIFNTTNLSLQVVASELDFATIVPAEECLAACLERSTGAGATRLLHWEVACLDPRAPVEELMVELEKRAPSLQPVGGGRQFSNDLNQALKKLKKVSSADIDVQTVAGDTAVADVGEAAVVKPCAPRASLVALQNLKKVSNSDIDVQTATADTAVADVGEAAVVDVREIVADEPDDAGAAPARDLDHPIVEDDVDALVAPPHLLTLCTAQTHLCSRL